MEKHDTRDGSGGQEIEPIRPRTRSEWNRYFWDGGMNGPMDEAKRGGALAGVKMLGLLLEDRPHG